MSQPNSHLVEPGVKYFLHESLKQCHEIKKEYYNLYYNIGGAVFLVGLLSIILWVKYKGKISSIEKQLKCERDKAHILKKIRAIPNPSRENSMITDLPKWE